MKLLFDSNQDYQLEAIASVLDLFAGQANTESRLEVAPVAGGLYSATAFGNTLTLSDAALLENLRAVQERNALSPSEKLEGLDFTVEMETGTGKTYVYLRTILELHGRYGFKKFIIVVPSVAVREGVLKSLELMREHFAALYDNLRYDAFVYDAGRLSRIRGFAINNTLQIMIMNIDAFNKDTNVIRRHEDALSGRRPLDFIQETNPLLILDEPQNMESERAKEAIASLNPLLTLRYSATHRNLYNLVYRLDPVKAYDLRLVKMIEVASVVEDAAYNKPFISVKGFKTSTKKPPTAQLELDVQQADGPKRKVVTVKGDEDLFAVTGRDLYQGYRVAEINAGDEYVSFANGVTVSLGERHGNNKDEVMRAQVRETIKQHFDKELTFSRRLDARLKVLSLFFIDRVANYAQADGKIRAWFTEAYEELRQLPKYAGLTFPDVSTVHNGYFATARTGEAKDTTGKTQADDEAYRLIMQAKDELLDPDVPLRFIFSHSALREGWDNPNVFQICTLNESHSEVRKRQEIGRGLRLPVLGTGERSFDETLNVLTVVANESYADFARAYQQEIFDETGVSIDRDTVKNARERRTAQLNRRVYLSEEFRELWERIKHKTRYAVSYSTADLIREAAQAIAGLPPATPPRISVRTGRIQKLGEDPVVMAARVEEQQDRSFPIPDVLGILQRETELTRTTLAAILKTSGRLPDLLVNPQGFVDGAVRAVQRVLQAFMIDGIEYEKVDDSYQMTLFESEELKGYLNKMLTVQNSVYDAIIYDSAVESDFARKLDERQDIKCFVKLPAWFKVETPIGTYNPDWAIVKENTERCYFVKETKSTTDKSALRESERYKIHCGEVHFRALGADFGVVVGAEDV